MTTFYGNTGQGDTYKKPVFFENDNGATGVSCVVDGRELFELNPAPFSNLEDGGLTTIKSTMTLFCPPVGAAGASETTALYIRVPHYDGVTNDFSNGIYIENPVEASWVSGACIKMLSWSAGDACYIGLLGDNTNTGADNDQIPSGGGGYGGGFGQEVASFRDRQSLYIATWQGLGSGGAEFPESVANQSNCIGYTALIHDDSTDPPSNGWSPFVLNNAAFLARNVPNNAFVAWLSNYAPSGYPIFHLKDFGQTTLWAVYTDGQMHMNSADAEAGDENKDPPVFLMRGRYWDGDSSEISQVQMSYSVSGAPTPLGLLRFDIGKSGAEVLSMQLGEAGDVTIAGNFTQSGTTMRIAGQRTIAASADAGNVGDMCANDTHLFYYGATRWYRVAWETATWS